MFSNKMRMLVAFTASVGLAEALFLQDRRLSTNVAGSEDANSTSSFGDELGNTEPESTSLWDMLFPHFLDWICSAFRKMVPRDALASAAATEPIYAVFRVEGVSRHTPGDREDTDDIAGTLTFHNGLLSREDIEKVLLGANHEEIIQDVAGIIAEFVTTPVQVSVNMRFATTPNSRAVQLSTTPVDLTGPFTGEPYDTTSAKALTAAAGLPGDGGYGEPSMQFTVVWARDTTGMNGSRGESSEDPRRPLSQKLERLGLKQLVMPEGKDVNVMKVVEKEATWVQDPSKPENINTMESYLQGVQVSDAIVWEVPRTKEREIYEWLDKYGQQ